MKKFGMILLFLLISHHTISFAQSIDLDSIRNAALDEALRCIKMTRGDLTLRNDYLKIDPFRLKKIDELMKNPLEISSFSEEAGLSLEQGKDSPSALLESGFKCLGLRAEETDAKEKPEPLVGLNFKETDKLPEELKKSINHLYLGLIEANFGWQEAFKELSSKEIDSLKNYFPILIQEDVEDEFKSVDELDKEQKYEEKLSKDLIPLLEKFELEKAYSENLTLCRTVEKVVEILENYIASVPVLKPGENDIIFSMETEYGRIIVGGFGSSIYEGGPRIIIDRGGDDQYNLGSSYRSSIILDFGGNDTHKSTEDYSIGSGFLGTGILIDKSGDDNYIGQNFSLGSGLFGVGILIDEGGNDKYYGDTFTQGAGSFGIGILSDIKGQDQYHGALFAQGFGFVRGFGALIDSSGNDSYFAGGKYKDILRYKDHFISLSQGFAFGIRPIMSGGFGFLQDFSGNDLYISDIFGQGSSYWWALGSLVDYSGNDKYISYQYAQGAATHLTLGLLLDKSGNDDYISHGVSQGCGHDLACGILEDQTGNDNYLSYDLSQGAGSANGFGIQIDLKGDDSYLVTLKSNTQGYGNPRRDYGSIGLFLDLSGRDKYLGNGEDNSWWNTPSMWGAGIDGEFIKAGSK